LRLLTFVAYQALATIAGLRQKYDVVIASNPGLEVAAPFLFLGALRRKPSVFSVHDLYPDVGVKLGIFRSSVSRKLVGCLEQVCLTRATGVRVLSNGFRNAIVGRGIPEQKVSTIWDWIDTDFVSPQPRRNRLSTDWGLDSKFVIQYAGNFGLSQGLDTVLKAAALLNGLPDIHFLLIGDGPERAKLEKAVRDKHAANVSLEKFLPRELMPAVLATCDVALVCLKRGMSAESVPSKLYSIMSAGRPVIGSLDSESDSAQLIRLAKCGIVVEPESPTELAEAIKLLYSDNALRREYAANGRTYVIEHHSRHAAASAFARLIEGMCDERDRGIVR
jgi:colanic acid biosynthesis glycosyl transferase WcaI